MQCVLIVDDKPENLYLLRVLLEGHGYAVEEARDGAEALTKARHTTPQLVISDLLMPVMDGYSLLREWKADARLKAIPFVVYTATYTHARDEQLALDLGADAFVIKPSEPDVFIAHIKEVLGKAAEGQLRPPHMPDASENVLLKEYSEVLVRKLEQKVEELDVVNRALNMRLAELEQLYTTAPVGLALVDREFRWLRINERLAAIDGPSVAEHLGRTPRELIPQLADVLEPIFRRVLATGQPQLDIEIHGVTPADPERERDWVASYYPFAGADGMVDGVGIVVEEVTERKRVEAELKEQRRRLAELSSLSSDWFWTQDREHRFVHVSHDSGKDFAGTAEVVGKARWELPVNVTPAQWAEHRALLEARQIFRNFEYSYLNSRGEICWNSVNGAPLFDAAGAFVGYHGTGRDITELKQNEAHLQLAAGVFTHSLEGIMITDVDGTIVEVNNAFSQITGYCREEALGQNPRFLQSDRHNHAFYAEFWQALKTRGFWSGELWNKRKNGEVYPELMRVSVVRDAEGVPRHYVALFSDITERRAHQDQLEHLAHFDPLTGLPNRLLLSDRLGQAIAQCQRSGTSLAVAYLDLDDTKEVNDNHGHYVGDALLVTVSHRIKDALREGDTLARIGGDEFVAILCGLERPADSYPVIERLLQVANEAVVVNHDGDTPGVNADECVQVTASIGVTFYPQDHVDADVLMRHADQAMYIAKQAGKNCYHLFDVLQDAAIRTRHADLLRIRTALDEGEFVLAYQPKVNMRSGEVTGAEALIRWQHPERGLLPPAAFLGVIEDHPISIEVGEWVIDTALSQMAAWKRSGLELTVSVNIGARQLLQDDFAERLGQQLAAHPELRPQNLQLEVLETSALEDINKASATIRACHMMGVSVALDDFGTGYSSLIYLKRLPSKVLKIDRSFVFNMIQDPDDLAIVRGVVELAEIFHREVIAEGVESRAHGDLLLTLGCDLAQDFGIARPMPAAELPQWIVKWQTSAEWTD